MTRKEFEDRTGMKVSEEEYAEIEEVYMQAEDMDKDKFCYLWKQAIENPLTVALAKRSEQLRCQLNELTEELKVAQEKNVIAARALLGRAAEDCDRNLVDAATWLVGERKCIEIALEEGYPLWVEAREWLFQRRHKV